MSGSAIHTELRPIFFDRLQEIVGQYCWVREGTWASKTMLVSVLFVSTLLLATASSSKTPVTTCCPPGSFLAIEDWQESRQLPNGLWVDSLSFNSMSEFKRHEVNRYGRHNYISRVSCVPDKNNLQTIDGFRGSSYPDPPYFASVQDKLLGLETRSKPLADDQILQSTGNFLVFLFFKFLAGLIDKVIDYPLALEDQMS